MAHHCPHCDVHWWPYQTPAGRCPQCGGGTRWSHEPASDDSVERHRVAVNEDWRRELYRRFEAYYAERERRRPAA